MVDMLFFLMHADMTTCIFFNYMYFLIIIFVKLKTNFDDLKKKSKT